jgi:hypothetical protein
MRNDTALYSGSNSKSYVEQRREARNEEKLNQQRAIVKDADFIFDVIEAHKKDLGNVLLGLTTTRSSEAEVKDMLNAIRIHRDFIAKLETKLKAVMRAKPREPING